MDRVPARTELEPALPPPLRRVFGWGWVWATLILAATTGAIVGYLLWGKTTADHKDAFDAAWKSAAAVLAVLAAFLSVDRFRLSQREHQRQLADNYNNHRHAEALLQRQLAADQAARDDAIARQITDLSAKASEQLGSDKAAVRIGGLTDLERLAHSHPQLRQTVIDRICAYLRAPYQPPPNTPHPITKPQTPGEPDHSSASDQEETAARRLELDVRRTAQQILKRHLYWPPDLPEPPPDYWTTDNGDGITLDLRDATLIEFDLTECRTAHADFRNAYLHTHATFTNTTFTGHARFDGATFSGVAGFDGATFAEDAGFDAATFTEDARFGRATFTRDARFGGATFTEDAWFGGATFTRDARFEGANFTRGAMFGGATFTRHTTFEGANFTGGTTFNGATFTEDAWFGAATFSGISSFGGATFTGHTRFVAANFTGHTTFVAANFTRGALFDGAIFTRGALLDRVTFTGPAMFVRVTFTGPAMFVRVTFTEDARFDRATFTEDARFDRATFTEDTSFNGATFSGITSFRGATFSGNADLGSATFKAAPDLEGARVLNLAATHSWPPLWRTAPHPDAATSAPLVRDPAPATP